ncbi:hypothetical protein, partial [Sandarakinorhabdus sp.]|uniref:hypothetical protein n=1 Tax=Sandarakinorhabdus sp. TaxID=1916663 RepID=UPI00286DBA11
MLLFALLLAASPPFTSTPAAQSPEDAAITVTGKRIDAATAQAGARKMVADVLPPSPRGGQYARWNTPLCLKVIGLESAPATLVMRRFMAIAAGAGAEMAKGRCKPNVSITFTADGAALATQLLQKRPNSFSYDVLAGADRDAWLNQPLPVRWWSATRIESADGSPAYNGPSTALMSAGGAADLGSLGNSDSVSLDSWSGSLIDSKARLSATSATVIVDVPRATGVDLGALASHIAMAVLSQARLRNQAAPDQSILGLFRAGPAAPTDLTPWDRALLTALYTT